MKTDFSMGVTAFDYLWNASIADKEAYYDLYINGVRVAVAKALQLLCLVERSLLNKYEYKTCDNEIHIVIQDTWAGE